jgi:sterol desaturase/sphingolipid hydroxylase (fatty acid hydroxylase superfamily)
MDRFIGQFQTATVFVVAAVFVALWVLEPRITLRQPKRSRMERLMVNAVLSALALGTGAFVIVPWVFQLMTWSAKNGFGLLHLLNLWAPLEAIMGFLLMDISFYYWHRVNHAFPFFWRFHNVHHVDPDLDVSTSFRFHFGEVFYSSAFRSLQILLLGISPFHYVVYELCFQCATVFHHSNLRFPIRVERWLNMVIVTPRMHGIHHSAVREETDSNFSVIFRWWDWVHGTLRLNIKQAEVVIGVPAYLQPEDNKIVRLLVLPFRKQREHWRLPDGTEPQRQPSASVQTTLSE